MKRNHRHGRGNCPPESESLRDSKAPANHIGHVGDARTAADAGQKNGMVRVSDLRLATCSAMLTLVRVEAHYCWTRGGWRSTWSVTALVCLSLPHLAVAADEVVNIGLRLKQLEARTDALYKAVDPVEANTTRIWVDAAAVAQKEDLLAASALYNLALRHGVDPDRRAQILVAAARTEAKSGQLLAARAHFLAASRAATSEEQMKVAMLGFVDMAERTEGVDNIPDVARFIELVGLRGRLNARGAEILYRLGRVLTVVGDPRGGPLLEQVPLGTPARRRALYVLGVFRLKYGARSDAEELFLRAAELPPMGLLPEEYGRDQSVREHAWLAVGRLAFEANEAPLGYYAYHQIPMDSPLSDEALLELGWLAMEAGDETTAMAAFEPLVDRADHGSLAREASLLKGYVMMRTEDYMAAADYYQRLAASSERDLEQFDREISNLWDLTELARDCATQRHAASNPLLAPILKQPELEQAQRLALQVSLLEGLAALLDQQRAAIDRLLAGEGSRNPLTLLAKRRQVVGAEIEQATLLSRDLEDLATRSGWSADRTDKIAAPDPCCKEPRQRLANVRQRLEGLAAHIDFMEREITEGLQSMSSETRALEAEQKQLAATIAPDVPEEQKRLVRAAVARVRGQLARLGLESNAGVLEVYWRYKEGHRDLLLSIERARQTALDQLYKKFSDVVFERSSTY